MEHKKLKADAVRCPMPDLKAYESGMDQVRDAAQELRGLLENHLGAQSPALKDFGHDINNTVAALNSAVVFSSDDGPPLRIVNALLTGYPERAASAMRAIRPHINDEAILQKLDNLQATTDILFDHLQRARESYAEKVTGFPYHEISNVKVLGTVGPDGQKGIWV